MMRRLLMLTAYRGMGKDTLCAALSQCGGKWRSAVRKLGYSVYSAPSTTSTNRPRPLASFLGKSSNVYRMSFADALKLRVFGDMQQHLVHASELKQRSVTTWQQLDVDKDKSWFTDPTTTSAPLISFRELNIRLARKVVAQDSEHWCKEALANMKKTPPKPSTDGSGDASDVLCVNTDFRRAAEWHAMRNSGEFPGGVATARVFRSCVPIPAPDAPLEHELDDWLTDYLVVSDTDWSVATKLFPQYKSYTKEEEEGDKNTRKRKRDEKSETSASAAVYVVYVYGTDSQHKEPRVKLLASFDDRDEAVSYARTHTTTTSSSSSSSSVSGASVPGGPHGSVLDTSLCPDSHVEGVDDADERRWYQRIAVDAAVQKTLLSPLSS